MSAATTEVAGIAEHLPSAGLDEVVAAASLQTRVDRKYLLGPAELNALRSVLVGMRALEIDGVRSFSYESVYFDTPDLALFRAHRQGRRRRWKARTRTYLDSGQCLFEVKTKDRRGQTVKARREHDPHRRGALDAAAHEFLAATLAEQYAEDVPVLVPSLTTRYRRTTFVDLAGGSRVTCDVGLRCTTATREVAGPDKVIVESKSTGTSPFDHAVAHLGLRPISMSKYCLGTALTRPELAANRWHRLLTREFGWRRGSGEAHVGSVTPGTRNNPPPPFV